MGGQRQPNDIIPEQYRAARLANLFSVDPALQAMLASLASQSSAGTPNVIAQLFRGAGGAPTLDMGVLPPELQVSAATPAGQTPATGTLPPQVQAQAGSATPAPAGSAIPVSPGAQAQLGGLKGGAERETISPQIEAGRPPQLGAGA